MILALPASPAHTKRSLTPFLLFLLALLPGVSSTLAHAQTVLPATASVHAGGTQRFTVTRNGTPMTGGFWWNSGSDSGNFDSDGTYHAPINVPSPSTLTVGYYYSGVSGTAQVTVTNPVPTPDHVNISSITQYSTPLAIHGAGFLPGSVISVQGKPMPTHYIGPDWLSTVAVLSGPVNGPVQLTVTNPNPGASFGSISVPGVFPTLSAVTPSPLVPGWITLSLKGAGYTSSTNVMLDGRPMKTTVNSATSLTATGYLPAWKSGTTVVGVVPQLGSALSSTQTLRIKPPSLSYDTAARFSTQAAFGPRPDLVEHIQQVGLQAFLTEQFAQPIVTYYPQALPSYYYMSGAVSGNSLLRLRVSTALQTFIVNQAFATEYQSFAPWERKIETDCFGNYRQLLTDITGDARLGEFLNLAGNYISTDPNIHPNQNFAREIMQLFSLGTVLLNDDGSVKLDASGHPIPTYDQNTILELTRALTGWNQATPVDRAYTLGSTDYSQPLAPFDQYHDHGAKVLFGNVYLPAGQSIVQDRTAALDAIFNHPNLPPFLATRLIGQLVTSNPTSAYVSRISAVFKNNGKGVRGDLAAVVSAILLDPEARAGDTASSATSHDGFLQDPLLWQLFAMNALQQPGWDGQVIYLPGKLGQSFWHANSVFGFYPQAFQIPGTAINSPQFSLFNNLTALHRSQYLYGMINGGTSGYGNTFQNSSWLFTAFTNVPDLVDALNHQLYHGQMPAAEQTAITNYCAGIPNLNQAFVSAIFLALNSDSFNVSH